MSLSPFYVTAVAGTESDRNNTLSSFKIRLKESKLLGGEYLVGLTSAMLPFNIFNIEPNTFCTVIRSRHRSEVYTEDKTSIEVENEEPFRKIGLDYDIETRQPHVLEYAIRLKINEGYYSSIDSIKKEMRTRAEQMFQNHDKYFLRGNFQNLTNLSLERGIDGLKPEFLIGRTLSKKKLHRYRKSPHDAKEDAANNILFFDRILFEPHTRKVVFEQDRTLHSERFYTRFAMSPSLAKLFGFYNNYILDLSFRYHSVLNSFQARIIPNELFFIYSDIIYPQLISGYEQPLLRILPVVDTNVEYGSYLNYEFDRNPEYVKLNTRTLDYIKFWITDIEGEPIKFEDTSKTVILKLKFIPNKNQ